ncbi:C6 transcription factor [Colletotrichum higginsianum IMI 349063]|uniref:C6 transcription factor n=1 Tax=Colletotrichum higginsianum (strain IMI 349063) TaxID=759273 RepID=A0A1B7YSM8_COLHI|nr:C6 transcription factor [Colletotrichum higginsianum IMI 349063]OBR15049.1 C6 transcription factor [Colletotrichum higginsianum IMI 349063]
MDTASSSSSEPRLRNSCESCRRSLGETGRSVRVLTELCGLSSGSKERVRRLETQVGQIYEILQSLTENRMRGSTASPLAPVPNRDDEASLGNGDDAAVHNDASEPQGSFFDPTASPEPPPDALEHLIRVYRKDIAFKPLPLFGRSTLRSRLSSPTPRFLRRSFLALTLRFGTHPFFRGKEGECADFYAASAYADLMPLALEGVATVEVVQSLCLLALQDLKVCKPARAWGTIGMAARLEVSRGWNRRELGQAAQDDSEDDESSRCFWSVYILEKAFSAQCSVLDRCVVQPRYPDSASLSLQPPPSTPPPTSTEGQAGRFDGINSSFLRVISIWGDVTSYNHGVRCSRRERPWLPTSRYTELTQKMYEFEDQTALKHLLKNAAFTDRTPADVSENLEYWRPWVLMQITHHATSAVLNHPFIHISGLGEASRRQPPRLFMQGVIDQAQYHAQWVGRLVQMCEAVQFDILDPLLGTLVAATATVAWVFRFAPDSSAASKSVACFDICEGFVRKVAASWPHIGQKVKLLESLRGVSGQTRGDGDSVITFRPSKLWELLDNSIIVPKPSPHSNITSSESNSRRESPLPDATLSVTTHILHPVDEDAEAAAQSQPVSPATTDNNGTDSAAQARPGDELCFDDFFSQYLPTEMNCAPEAVQVPMAWQNLRD